MHWSSAWLTPALSLLLLTACGKAVDPDPGPDTGDESCFNGTDDDEDALVDCADPNCGEVATCVPVAEAIGLEAGTVVEAGEPCPEGFEGGEVLIHQDLEPGACAGCDCSIASTGCTGRVWYYLSSDACIADVDLTGGIEVTEPVTFDCTGTPIDTGTVQGVRAEIEPPPCTAGGTAEPSTPTWGRSMKFCGASIVGGGCAANQACVGLRPQPEAQCALVEGDIQCAGFGSTESDWFTGFDAESDTRTCGACSCTSVGCEGVDVRTGSDYVCEDNTMTISDGTKTCFQVYAPPVQLIGDVSSPVACTAEAPVSGEVLPSGQQTLCCAPD